jgi:hypothetical protein
LRIFISHWSAASPSERANSQPFLLELCDLLDVPRPDPHPANGYFFEFPVVEHHPDGTTGKLDEFRVRDEWFRWKNIAKSFGYFFFGFGLVLLALIIYAMLSRLVH